MPLPSMKKNDAAATAATDAPAKKRGLALPAMPDKGLKARKQYLYLHLPKAMDNCFYRVKLLEAKIITAQKTNLQKVALNFEILETDVPLASGIKVGSEASESLDMQGDRSLYFWANFASITLALCGVPETDESLSEFSVDAEATLNEVLEEGSLNGKTAIVRYRAGFKSDGKPTFYTSWEAV